LDLPREVVAAFEHSLKRLREIMASVGGSNLDKDKQALSLQHRNMMSSLYADTAKAKSPVVVKWIRRHVLPTKQKCIIFAHHQQV
jgi:hypothetical protein